MTSRAIRRTCGLILAGLLLAACGSLRQPSPYTGFLPDTDRASAVDRAMGAMESLGYRIQSVERDGGLIVGVRGGALRTTRVTVTVRENAQMGGVDLRVVGESSGGADVAEEAARAVRAGIEGR